VAGHPSGHVKHLSNELPRHRQTILRFNFDPRHT
jgi:hypothetical protein